MATDFRNSGSGSQYNSTSGNQNNNSGSGNQFNANTINYNAQNQSDSKLLADLRVIDPCKHKARIERRKGGLLRDSYRWILDHEAFIRWQTDTQSSLLWIRGDPGKGKTMLVCGIIDELPKLMPEWETIYFFCEATDSSLNNATTVLRSLLYLLLRKRPSLSRFILEEHEHAGKRLFEDANAWDVLDETFTNIAQDGGLKDFILIIDALDECTADLDQLLDFIVRLSSSNFKVIVSSRNWLSIEEVVVDVSDQVCISLELNEMSVSAAVNRYISYKVDQLAKRKKYDIDTRNYVHDCLSSKANDTFLWVALVTDQLGKPGVSERHARMKVEEFPRELDALYKRMLDRTWNSNDKDKCRRILAVVSIVYRPITLLELMSLADLGEFCNKTQILEEIIGECGSLLAVKDNIVYFVHQSAKDFLFRHALAETMPHGIRHEHSLLLPRSLKAMSKTCCRNIYNLKEPGASLDDICTPVPDPLGPARYACVYWLEHVDDARHTDRQYSQVYEFLRQHFLHWIEALSLLKSMSIGIASLFKLARAIQASETSEQKLFVQDALRFIRYFRVAVENWPLQVYSSALAFSPAHSIIRKRFQREVAGWILKKPKVDDEWNPCLQTLEGHTDACISLAFSADGVTLASASMDNTVKIWDLITGECLRTLQIHGFQLVVAFSYKGEMLASASESGVVKLWDKATGRLLNTFHASSPGRCQPLVSFCADDKQVVLVSSRTVEVWDICTGQSVRQVHGFDFGSDLHQAGFSADGSLFASMTGISRVGLFDTKSWACSTTFDVHNCPIFAREASLALSGDGTQLLFRYENDTLGLWDTKTGTERRWAGQEFGRCPIACSQDGGLIACVANRSIKIRDGETGKVLQTLPIPFVYAVTALVFSPNSTQLVSAAADGNIKVLDLTRHQKRQLNEVETLLWDTPSAPMPPKNIIVDEVLDTRRIPHGASPTDYPATDQDIDELDDYHSHPRAMAFSHDGSQLALVSTGSISLWDFTTGQCLKTTRHYLDEFLILSFVYSVNGILLATTDTDREFLTVWDVGTDLQLETRLRKHTYREDVPWDVAFSNDGTILASLSSSNKTIKLWDSTTGDCKATFILPEDVNELEFSESGSHLITDIGDIDLEFLTSTSAEMSTPRTPEMTRSTTRGFMLSEDDGQSWIHKDSKPILWLPPEYRGWVHTARGSAIAVGTHTGRVLMMEFSPDLSVM